ncbi:MAG: gamma carbonic anhydrase family protein, partial [Myxococcota bacterium]
MESSRSTSHFGPDVRLDPSAFLLPGVQLYGRIEVGRGSSLWPHVVVRAEAQRVTIGRYTNLQDFVMVHVGYDHPTLIGDHVSVTHHATVHGATIEDACLVGVGAVIMDGARVGAGSIVAGGAVITEGSEFPPGSIIAGVPARAIRQRDSARANRLNAWQYHRNARCYRAGDHRAWDGPEYDAWLAATRAAVETDRDLDWDPDLSSDPDPGRGPDR